MLTDVQLRLGDQRGWQGRRALDFIRGRLVTGSYRPGESLPIDQLASEVGVSRQTILEAMRSLAQGGLVSIVPQVGCQVAVHSVDQIGDFFLLFARVEAMLAGLAADRHAAADLSRLRLIGAEIGELGSSISDMSERGERHRLLNKEFHGTIHAMARAPEIAGLARGLWDRSDFHLATTPNAMIYAERLDIAHVEHGSVLESLKRRDAETSESIMREHVLGFRQAVLAGIEADHGSAADHANLR